MLTFSLVATMTAVESGAVTRTLFGGSTLTSARPLHQIKRIKCAPLSTTYSLCVLLKKLYDSTVLIIAYPHYCIGRTYN